MRRKKLFCLLLAFVLLFAGCANNVIPENSANDSDQQTQDLHDDGSASNSDADSDADQPDDPAPPIIEIVAEVEEESYRSYDLNGNQVPILTVGYDGQAYRMIWDLESKTVSAEPYVKFVEGEIGSYHHIWSGRNILVGNSQLEDETDSPDFAYVNITDIDYYGNCFTYSGSNKLHYFTEDGKIQSVDFPSCKTDGLDYAAVVDGRVYLVCLKERILGSDANNSTVIRYDVQYGSYPVDDPENVEWTRLKEQIYHYVFDEPTMTIFQDNKFYIPASIGIVYFDMSDGQVYTTKAEDLTWHKRLDAVAWKYDIVGYFDGIMILRLHWQTAAREYYDTYYAIRDSVVLGALEFNPADQTWSIYDTNMDYVGITDAFTDKTNLTFAFEN